MGAGQPASAPTSQGTHLSVRSLLATVAIAPTARAAAGPEEHGKTWCVPLPLGNVVPPGLSAVGGSGSGLS